MNVYSDTLSHDAVLVWLAPPTRDVVGGVQMRTAPPPNVSDAVVVADLATLTVVMALAVSDASPGADVVTPGLSLPVLAVDTGAPGEAVSARQNVLLPAVGDDLASADAVTLALVLPGLSVSDALVATDAVELRSALVGVDALTPTDTATVQMPVQAVGADDGAAGELVQLYLNVLTLAVFDAPAPADVAALLAPVVVQVGDDTVVDERRNVATAIPKKIKVRGRAGTR